MRVVICGGGVIGAATAYFLSQRGVDVTVVERSGVACAASGKSGGFLALDWCDGSPLEALARRSFALHAALAEEIGEDYGYRRMTTYGGVASAGQAARDRPGDVAWVSGEVALSQRLGTTETTAQVHPGAFTKAMMRAAEGRGTAVKRGRVTGLTLADGGRAVTGVTVSGETLEADAVVIAMGPWSILASVWLPLPGVFGLKGHSLVFETDPPLPADALFVEYREASGERASPEVFPRTDGTTYVCGISSQTPLPVDPAAVAPDPGAIERLEAICAGMAPALAGARIVARQSCFRPVTEDGLPLIGAIAGIAGAYVATGHSVWGILNAPATGEAVAGLIVDGVSPAVDLSPFDPGRLRPFDPAHLKTQSG